MSDLIRFFKSKLKARESTNGWYRFINPFDKKAHRDNMAVNFEYNWVKDFASEYSVNIYQFISDYDGRSYSEIASEFGSLDFKVSSIPFESVRNIPKSNLPDGYKRLLYPKGNLGERARNYIKGRGLDVEYMDMMGFGYCTEGDYQGYIIIPFKEDNQLVYYTARDFIGNSLKHKNPKQEDVKIGKGDVMFNSDCLYMYDEVNIGEGVFDASTAGANGLSTGGWSLSIRQFSMLATSPVKRFTIIPDVGYVEKAMRTFSKLAEHKEVYFCNIDLIVQYDEKGKRLKDINELGKKTVMKTRFGPVDSFDCQFADFKKYF